MKIRFLYLSTFFAGMAALAVENSSVRMLGNIFGTSDIVWSAVIAMVLVYLSLGYFVGGGWADRFPYYTTFYGLLAWAAFACALIPFLARPALLGAGMAFSRLDILTIVLWVLALIVIFFLPLTLLGCVSPFVIRLLVSESGLPSSGRVSGQAYAVSTLGSIVGVFGSAMLLIPSVGASRTFLIFACGLLLIALVGLVAASPRKVLRYVWMPVVLAGLAWVGVQGPIRPPPPGMSLLYERETAYNFVQVVEDGAGTRYLLLNEGIAVHSMYNPNYPVIETHGTWDFFLVGPYFNQPPHKAGAVSRIAVIGLAGGTIPAQYTAVYGPIPIDGIEIDPVLIEVGQKYFGMTMPNLNPIAGDGRVELHRLGKGYSVVGIDAYRVPYVPWHLLTVEFFQEVRSHLADDGVVVLNVGRTPINRELVDAATATLLEVFPSVHVMDVPNSFNSILVATVQPTEPANLQANYEMLVSAGVHPLLTDALRSGIASLQPARPSEVVFTDDHAPVEGIVHKLILEFLLQGDPRGSIGGLGDQ